MLRLSCWLAWWVWVIGAVPDDGDNVASSILIVGRWVDGVDDVGCLLVRLVAINEGGGRAIFIYPTLHPTHTSSPWGNITVHTHQFCAWWPFHHSYIEVVLLLLLRSRHTEHQLPWSASHSIHLTYVTHQRNRYQPRRVFTVSMVVLMDLKHGKILEADGQGKNTAKRWRH